MSLSIFPAIFDLIAAAGSHLRVTAALSSSPCKVDTHCAPHITGRALRELRDTADTAAKRFSFVSETVSTFFFFKKMLPTICHDFQLLIKVLTIMSKSTVNSARKKFSYLSHFTDAIIQGGWKICCLLICLFTNCASFISFFFFFFFFLAQVFIIDFPSLKTKMHTFSWSCRTRLKRRVNHVKQRE